MAHGGIAHKIPQSAHVRLGKWEWLQDKHEVQAAARYDD